MTDEMYAAITRLARAIRASRYEPDHPKKTVGDQLQQEWPELWADLDVLQKDWLE